MPKGYPKTEEGRLRQASALKKNFLSVAEEERFKKRRQQDRARRARFIELGLNWLGKPRHFNSEKEIARRKKLAENNAALAQTRKKRYDKPFEKAWTDPVTRYKMISNLVNYKAWGRWDLTDDELDIAMILPELGYVRPTGYKFIIYGPKSTRVSKKRD